MSTEKELLINSRFTKLANSALNDLLDQFSEIGPIVFVSPNKSVVMVLSGSYLNVFLWDRRINRYVCQEVSSRGDVSTNYDLTLKQIDVWTKETYVYFMQSWFDITIDPSTLD